MPIFFKNEILKNPRKFRLNFSKENSFWEKHNSTTDNSRKKIPTGSKQLKYYNVKG